MRWRRAHLGLGLEDLATVDVLEHPVPADVHHLDAEGAPRPRVWISGIGGSEFLRILAQNFY